jgi:diguanylate cyclase (GGDEF)-like protein/PAS domain S-box-containing protein
VKEQDPEAFRLPEGEDGGGANSAPGALFLEAEVFRTAFENAPIGVAVVTPDGRYRRVNPALCEFLGYSELELLTKTWREVTDPTHLELDTEQTTKLLNGEIASYQLEKQYVHARGHLVWGHLSATLVRDEHGAPLYFVCQIQDITNRKLAEQRLIEQALHDPLTGVANRLLFMDRLSHALARADRSISPVAVLFLDLDLFKSVNDRWGHRTGDQVLINTARRIGSVVRPSDTVARLGGDEFAILCEDMKSEQDAVIIAERLCREFTSPTTVEGMEIPLTASIGIAFAQEGDDPDSLLRHADAAMYSVKEGGRGTYEIYLDAV